MAPTLLLPEFARDSHLDTRMTPGYCIHLFKETPTVTRKEIWKRTKCIGIGGFGTVWLETCIEGQEGGGDTHRAVKVLQLPSDALLQEAIAQCSRELEAFAKFSQRKYSRCFVKSHGWFEDVSSISICLEYLPLGDLRTYIAKRADPRLPEPEAKQIISQILDGLAFMHAEGFAHRDLKPANVLIKSLGPDHWWVKLSDFGLSKRAGVTQSATGVQGTPGFMAPELLGFLAYDKSLKKEIWYPADMWCLGEVAFQLVTGRATFPDPVVLSNYMIGKSEFPASELHKVMASPEMVDFVSAIMIGDYTQRPTARNASTHQWLRRPETASLVLPQDHVDFDSSRECLENPSDLDRTAPSIEYRNWSTVTSAPANSPQDLNGIEPLPLSLEEAVDSGRTVSHKFRALHNIPNQEPRPIVITQRLSEVARLSLLGLLYYALSSWSTIARILRQIRSSNPLETYDQKPEPDADLEVSARRGLVEGPEWYSESTNTHRHTKALTTAAINELMGSSEYMPARVLQGAALKGTQLGSHQLLFSPNCTILATTSVDESVGLWNVRQKALIRTIESTGKYAAFSPSSRQIATVKQAGDACIMKASLDPLDQSPRTGLRESAEEIHCVAFSSTGRLVAGTSGGQIIVWGANPAEKPKEIKAHSSRVLWVACRPDLHSKTRFTIVGAAADGWFSFWEYEHGEITSEQFRPAFNEDLNEDRPRVKMEGRISAAAASKSFTRLAVASLDGSITMWHNVTGEPWLEGLRRESVLKGDHEHIDVMDFSPDSKLLASASSESVRIWQVREGLPVAVIQAPGVGIARAVAFSPDSTFLASTSSKSDMVHLWDAKKVQDLSDIQDHLDRASFIAVSPDQRYLASAVRGLQSDEAIDTDVATLMIWDVAQARPLTLMNGHGEEILSVSFSEDSKRVGSISAGHILCIWDVETGECLDMIASRTNKKDTMPCASLSAGLRHCAAVFRYYFKQKLTRRKGDCIYETHSGFAISLCEIRLEEQISGYRYPCKGLPGIAMENDILAVTFSPDATKLAAIDQDENVTLWDTSSGAMTTRLTYFNSGSGGGRISFKPDLNSTRHFAKYCAHMRDVGNPALRFVSETEIAVFSGLSVARFWNLEGGGQLFRRFGRSTIGPNHNRTGLMSSYGDAFSYCSYSTPLTVSPDGTRCVSFTTSGEQLALWDVGTTEPVTILAEDAPKNSGDVRRARLASLKERIDIRHVSFSPDSRWLVTASGKDMMVRDAVTGRTLTGVKFDAKWPLRMVTFWPDSRYVVSGCYNGMLQFWDIQSGAMVKAFEGHTGRRRVVL